MGIPAKWKKHMEYVKVTNSGPMDCVNGEYANCEANIEKLHNGDLVVVFQETTGNAGHDFNSNICLLRSTDGGRTWNQHEKVTVFRQGPDHGYNIAGITQLADGTLISNGGQLMFGNPNQPLNNQAPGGNCRGAGVWTKFSVQTSKSTDNGYTWSEPSLVNVAPRGWASCRNSIVELPDQSLLMPLYGSRGWHAEGVELGTPDQSFILWSGNKGESWHPWGTIAIDPAEVNNYHEPALLCLKDGRMISMMRMHTIPNLDPPGGYLFFCVSEDDGSTWSLPRRTELWGYPADLIQLQDGRVLCVYGYRRGVQPGVRACISEDGTTWKKENEFLICGTPNTPAALLHLGYPSSTQLDDGTIVTVYHRYWWDCTKWQDESASSVAVVRQNLPPLPMQHLLHGILPWRHFIEAAIYTL
jgi:hypothetical protein